MNSKPSPGVRSTAHAPRAATLMPARAPQVTGVLVAALGLTVLCGWLLQIEPVVRIVPGFIAMVFNTALCFVLTGAALATKQVIVRRALASTVAVIAAMVWSQDFFRIDLGIDQLILRVWFPDTSPFPGRMAPQTCICFLLAAFTLFSLKR